jgi:hypothetical protein
MSEKIFLTYTNATAVPYQGSVLGHHIVLNYIDSNGDRHTLQGVPENPFVHNIEKLWAFIREEALSDGANNRDSPFRRLQAKETFSEAASEVSLNQPHTMVAEGDDLSSRWALMQDFADEVNSTGYEYRPVSQNSNSFAGGALQRAGFSGPFAEFPERFDNHLVFDPVSGNTERFDVPGFDMPLRNPIDTATPMPFPLSALAPPLVAANPLAAPERPASFDNHFGNRGAIPTGDTDNPPSPVLRELQKYKRAAAVDAASPWAQTAVPTSLLAGMAPIAAGFRSGRLPSGAAASNLPSGASAFGDQLENTLRTISPDDNPMPQIRRISSAFRDITAENPNRPVPPTEPTPLLGN